LLIEDKLLCEKLDELKAFGRESAQTMLFLLLGDLIASLKK